MKAKQIEVVFFSASLTISLFPEGEKGFSNTVAVVQIFWQMVGISANGKRQSRTEFSQYGNLLTFCPNRPKP